MAKDENETLHRCPSCGGKIPLVDKTCDYCGYRFLESAGERYTPESLRSMIAESLDEMKRGAKSGFFRILLRNYYIALPAMALLSLLAAFAEGGDAAAFTFFGLSGAAVIAILVKVIRVAKKLDKRSGLNLYRAQYEQYARIARAYYGDDTEIRRELGAFGLEVGRTLDRLCRAQTRTFVILALLISSFVFVSVKKIRETSFVPQEIRNEEYVAQFEAMRWSVLVDEVEGPIAEYWRLVPASYAARFEVYSMADYSSSKFIIGDVKFIVERRLVAEIPGKAMEVKAVLLDAAGLEIDTLSSRKLFATDALLHGAGEQFVSFDELDSRYYAHGIAGRLRRGTRAKIVSAWVEKEEVAR